MEVSQLPDRLSAAAAVPQKYYISIEVQYGDTLGSIADTYNSGTSCSRKAYIRELMRMNHLTDDRIFAGTWLMIPCYEK